MNFLHHFELLEDPRSHINRKHNLLDVLFLTVSAVLSGAEGWKAIKEFGDIKLDWLRQFRPFESGIPVDDTIARIISVLEPDAINSCMLSYTEELRKGQGKGQVALDGKTLRRSFNGQRSSALHSITAWCHESGLVLTQGTSEGKKNENQGVLALIEKLELKGCIVSVDAMNTQKTIAAAIDDKGAGYYLCVKDNHKKLKQEIAAYFHKTERDNPLFIKKNRYQETDQGHGRIEVRTCTHLPITEWISEGQKWQAAQSIVKVERQRIRGGNTEEEIQYYLSSEPINPKAANKAIRNHWGVENCAHYVLDVTFREDDSRIRRENAPENMAVIRRLVMNLARRNHSKNSIKGKINQAGWSDRVRENILFG